MAPNLSYLLGAFILLLLVTKPLIAQSNDTSQPFSFLKNLEGCHKGQKVSGLHELKRYLEKFGYLNSVSSPVTNEDDDEFDDLLESAVKLYQANYHLDVTRDLDSGTIQKMMLPRCGVADIVNGTNTMSRRNLEQEEQSIHTVSHFSFFPNRPRWPPSKTHLSYEKFFIATTIKIMGSITNHKITRYHFHSSSSARFRLQRLRSIFSRSFKRWQDVSPFTFQEALEGASADIEIGFYHGDHGDGVSFDGQGGTLAHSFAPTRGWLHYDADENWSSDPITINQVDLETVAMHEIGHILGLGHSSVVDAIMFASIPYGSLKMDLHPNDIAGIRTLYPYPISRSELVLVCM